jgi:hypothetical protein
MMGILPCVSHLIEIIANRRKAASNSRKQLLDAAFSIAPERILKEINFPKIFSLVSPNDHIHPL